MLNILLFVVIFMLDVNYFVCWYNLKGNNDYNLLLCINS